MFDTGDERQMKNEKLQKVIDSKGITLKDLSEQTNIPMTTLRRIVLGSVTHVKTANMHAIARALNTSVDAIFDVPSGSPIQPIRPDEAGEPVTRTLSRDESFLLYWYQNVTAEDKNNIYEFARKTYYKTQNLLAMKASGVTVPANGEDNGYEQIELDLRDAESGRSSEALL